MTLIEAINNIDAIKPNTYTQSEKIKWLSDFDGIVKTNVIDTHESETEIEFNGYTDDTPLNTELLVGDPYEDIYICWLESKIDYANGEYTKYNNSITRFNDLYKDFCSNYNRTHVPKGHKIKYF